MGDISRTRNRSIAVERPKENVIRAGLNNGGGGASVVVGGGSSPKTSCIITKVVLL